MWQQQLFHRNLLCIERRQVTILCRNLVPEEMADCIVPLHCLTGCDANSARVNKLLVYDKVAKSAEVQQQLSKCATLKTKQDNDDEEDNHVTQRYDDSSESSDTDSIDSTSDAKC